MSSLIRFSPDLGAWLGEHLQRGESAVNLCRTMIAEGMAPPVAQTIVDAFVAARAAQRPLPVDAVSYDEAAAYVYETPLLAAGSRIATGDATVRVIARAERPMLALLAGVLQPDECAQLIALARPRLQPSTVVDVESGKDVVAAHRSSFGMFFRPRENALITRLDQRIAELMNLPVDNGEGLQVLHYPAGAASAAHFDFLQPSNAANRASIARSGQRCSTLVCYLNDVEQGGETIFPEAGWSVSPQRGHAVYFEYSNRYGQLDRRSLHASQAVLRGEKWVLSKWMRQRRFVSAGAAADAA